MEAKEHRRKSKRYPIQWKAGVVFDRAANRPTLHTQTDDLSAGGAAIHSPYGDLTGAVVTLLLAQPPGDGTDAPRMIRLRAQIVSSLHKPGKANYRHGLSFVRTPGDGLDMLEELLKAYAPTANPAAAGAAPGTAPAAPMSRLEMLKQMAQAKLAAPAAEDPSAHYERRIGDALARASSYLEDLTRQLDVVKPPFAGRGYHIPSVPEFSGLAWSDGNLNVRNKSNATIEQVGLYYTFSGNRQLRIAREYPASDKLRQQLSEYKIDFQYNDKKNEKGFLLNTIFGFPCEVKAQVVFQGQFDTGKLLLKMRNVERFGSVEYLVTPEAVTQDALEELAGHILGEVPHISLLRKTV